MYQRCCLLHTAQQISADLYMSSLLLLQQHLK
jgi:hypothetical protein